jgi:hypothetical protein
VTYCRVCSYPAEGQNGQCYFCGSQTQLHVTTSIGAQAWECPFERKGDAFIATPKFRLASLIGRQYDTVIAGGAVFDGTPGWRHLLVELGKLTKVGGFLHIEMARPRPQPTEYAWQAIAPHQFGREVKPLGFDIINHQFTPERQAYWLQKMDEVFAL